MLAGTFQCYQYCEGFGKEYVQFKGGPGEMLFLPLNMVNFNANSAGLFTKLIHKISRKFIGKLCNTEIDLYMYMCVKLILVTL